MRFEEIKELFGGFGFKEHWYKGDAKLIDAYRDCFTEYVLDHESDNSAEHRLKVWRMDFARHVSPVLLATPTDRIEKIEITRDSKKMVVYLDGGISVEIPTENIKARK